MGRLKGKICLITGAAGNIGRAFVQRFSDEEAIVLAADIKEFDTTGYSGKVEYLKLDLTSEESVAELESAILKS
jgi:NAD(P)-dependent dehydrogenase (short-subunit alcohol dehydrogenase family)